MPTSSSSLLSSPSFHDGIFNGGEGTVPPAVAKSSGGDSRGQSRVGGVRVRVSEWSGGEWRATL